MRGIGASVLLRSGNRVGGRPEIGLGRERVVRAHDIPYSAGAENDASFEADGSGAAGEDAGGPSVALERDVGDRHARAHQSIGQYGWRDAGCREILWNDRRRKRSVPERERERHDDSEDKPSLM